MKKILTMTILCLVLSVMAGCDEKSELLDDLETQSEEQSITPTIDYDLTEYTAQIATATMTDMRENPEKYIGKVIKVRGRYFPEYMDMLDRDINWLLVDDETGCCVNYFEFKLNDEEYPPEETRIEIIGTFGFYDEGVYTDLPYLAVDDFLELEV